MSVHNAPFQFYQSPLAQRMVTETSNITFDRMGCVIPVDSTAVAVAATLLAPTRAGIIGTVVLAVVGGNDLTLTVTNSYNANDDTGIVFTDAQDFVTLISIESGGTFYWRVIGHEGTNVISEDLDVDQLSLGGTLVTSTAAEINQMGGDWGFAAMTPGTGISTGTGTVCDGNVTQIGPMFKTEIFIDLTGLTSAGANQIIGKAPGVANCHIGLITAAKNGTIHYGQITCLETPVGGDPDIDFYGSADEATGAQAAALTTITGEAKLLDHGDWTVAPQTPVALTALPDPNGYLYMVDGIGTAVIYTAGQFLLELWGE